MWNHTSRLSNPGSVPVFAAILLISASCASGIARRVDAGRCGFPSLRAGFWPIVIGAGRLWTDRRSPHRAPALVGLIGLITSRDPEAPLVASTR
jgi:hypothetical protein